MFSSRPSLILSGRRAGLASSRPFLGNVDVVHPELAKDGQPGGASAIERILAAERESEKTLQECRRQAQLLVEAAWERANAIGRRAEARISKLYASYGSTIDEDAAALVEGPTSIEASSSGRQNIPALRRAAARLAAKLTGGDDEASR